ncbi:MAG TPA: DMT family transporter [Mesorhizobium sp.]
MTQSRHDTDAATPPAAIWLLLGSGLAFACLDTSAKYLVTSGMSPQFVSWMRFVEHAILALILLRSWTNIATFRVNNLPLQLLRGMFLVGATVFNFFALRTLQLADAMSIMFFGPMMITALAGPMLGEWAGWRRWLAIAVAFIGVLVIARPGFVTIDIGHIYVFCSMISGSLYAIMTRYLAPTETPESLIFYSALAPAILLAPFGLATASMPAEPLHWVVLSCLGLFGGVGHWWVIQAYRRASATALAPYPYAQMVWMIISGYLVFNQLPDLWTLVGAAIIVASGLYIVHREHRLRLANRTLPTVEDATLSEKL